MRARGSGNCSVPIRRLDRCSVSRFASVANRQDHDFLSVIVIQRDVGATSEFNHPLTEFRWHFFYRAAYLGVPGECLNTLANRFDGAPGGILAFRCEELVQTGNVEQRWLRPLQTRHFGGAAFLPTSSLASHASASSALRCRPVAW